MRAVTAEEIKQIAGGLAKRHSSLVGAHPMSTIPITPVTVTAGGGGSGGGGGGGGGGYKQPPVGGHGGGGGGSGGHYGETLVDGQYYVPRQGFTSNNGYNNPGDVENSAHQLIKYTSEYIGSVAAAKMLDENTGNNYGNKTITQIGFQWVSANAKYPHQQTDWVDNVEKYMSSHGYDYSPSFVTPKEMGQSEFDVFLDAVWNAEGQTNM
ncbi:MAG: hypothetical protein ACRETQ_08515 [Gammaproteobacteria bacterium]